MKLLSVNDTEYIWWLVNIGSDDMAYKKKYLSHCWHRSTSPNVVTRSQLVHLNHHHGLLLLFFLSEWSWTPTRLWYTNAGAAVQRGDWKCCGYDWSYEARWSEFVASILPPHISQTRGVKITSSLRQNDVATSFWRNNDFLLFFVKIMALLLRYVFTTMRWFPNSLYVNCQYFALA